ncbi:MAG: bacillithiol system redox-active protein YtxJ [Chlorobi bacterium]|nr:bacillithiol system redox-active protein YtxJ [Chlorobiota bacterium]MCI0715293.1 bacillithiol system redox-active protein YtxJ [Chlorobiota bacterium]
MNWLKINSEAKIREIKELSQNGRVLIFKYSPRCVVSYLMRTLFEREWHEEAMKMETYLLNVREYKELSDKIASELGVEHASPQILVIEKGKCVFSASHGKVLVSNVKQFRN